jgi:hypothetical protein
VIKKGTNHYEVLMQLVVYPEESRVRLTHNRHSWGCGNTLVMCYAPASRCAPKIFCALVLCSGDVSIFDMGASICVRS